MTSKVHFCTIFVHFSGCTKKVRKVHFYIDVGSRHPLLLYPRDDFHYRLGLWILGPKILGAPRSENFKICTNFCPVFHLPQKRAFLAKNRPKSHILGQKSTTRGVGPPQRTAGVPSGSPGSRRCRLCRGSKIEDACMSALVADMYPVA